MSKDLKLLQLCGDVWVLWYCFLKYCSSNTKLSGPTKNNDENNTTGTKGKFICIETCAHKRKKEITYKVPTCLPLRCTKLLKRIELWRHLHYNLMA